MKIYDCFTYCGEDLLLKIRLESLFNKVDKFIIIEGNKYFNGETKSKFFDINKFEKYQKKINYYFIEDYPKHVGNNWEYEFYQRNQIKRGLTGLIDEDIILISDVDEIPNLKKVNFLNIKEKIIMFQQDMFYYKFNLKLPQYVWVGTKGCRKKDLISPQWLRNIKDKRYPFYRLDTFFSKNKYSSIRFISDGGWHFTNIKSAKEIEYKLRSYLHHLEFDINPLTVEEIKEIMDNKHAIYNLNVDQRATKFGKGPKLLKFEFDRLPDYIKKNKKKFERWLD